MLDVCDGKYENTSHFHNKYRQRRTNVLKYTYEVYIMSRILKQENKVDVICQHTRDGAIIPIKLRVVDEDGQYQTYLVRSYKDMTNYGEADNHKVATAINHMWTFDCIILVFGRERRIRLIYNSFENLWRTVDYKT